MSKGKGSINYEGSGASHSVVNSGVDPKRDTDYVFYELTRSICPECRRVIDGHILIRDNKVYLRKRLVFIAFTGICIWAFSDKRKADFEAAALLPFSDEADHEGTKK